MEAKPLQITIPSTLSGKLGEYTKSWEKEEWKNRMVVDQMKKSSGSVVKEEEGSPPSIKLGLGIGKISNHVVEQGQGSKRAIMLTPAQLNELEKQALIYKYIAARLPVPLYLLLPIWKSLASSSGFVNGGIYKQYPSFIGFNPQGFDYRTMMDPEPKRCRRTDGKKWRCSKDVVPNEKYCERHIHRGRQRSRKHVELPKTACPSYTKTPINDNNTGNSTTHLSIAVPIGLQLRIPTCDTNITSIGNPSTTISANQNNERDDNFGLRKDSTPTAIPIPTTRIVAATAVDTNKSSRCNVDGKENQNSYVKQYLNVNRSCNNVEIGSKVSPMLGFSPDSVLQRPTILGYRSSCAHYGSYIDPEPKRCRRTDGKKWRCSNDVVPDKKYCVRHMHRGAKRQKEGCQADAIAVADSRCAPAAKISKTEDSINMNTNLSMGISTNSQVVLINYERSTTTTSSSETISANSSCHEYSTAARARA